MSFNYCSGAETISGTVYDYYGTTAVGGVKVSALDSTGEDTTVYETVSDSTGAWSLSVPEAYSYYVAANPNDTESRYQAQYYYGSATPYYATLIDTTEGPVPDVNFYLWAGYQVEGRVINEADGAVEASLFAYDNTTGYYYWGLTGATSSATNGSYSLNLPQGIYAIMVYGADGSSYAEHFPVMVNDDVAGLEISVIESGTISGTVTAGMGTPLDQVGVTLIDDVSGAAYATVITDETGYYEVQNVPAGRSYLVLARTRFHPEFAYYDIPSAFYPDRFIPDNAQSAALPPGGEATGIDIQLKGASGLIRGTVTNSAGDPVEGALLYDFYIADVFNGVLPHNQRYAYTDSSGHYEMYGLAPGASFGVAVIAEGYISQIWDGKEMTTTLAEADVLQLSQGETLEGIDFVLRSTEEMGEAPVIEQISPHIVVPGGTKTITLTGTGFSGNGKVELLPEYALRLENSGISIISYNMTDAGNWEVILAVPANIEPGPRYLSVTNPDSQYSYAGFHVIPEQESPQMSILCSPEIFTNGSTMGVGINISNYSGESALCDAFIALMLPDNSVFFFDGADFTEDPEPAAPDMSLPDEFFVGQTLLFEIPLPVDLPMGTYTWMSALLEPGFGELYSLSMKSMEFVTD